MEISTGDAGEQRAYPLARVDELWLRFADPRTPGAYVWAVSVMDEAGVYGWLTRAEAPAAWDQVGLRRKP